MLEELAYRRVSFRGGANYEVMRDTFERFGTHKPPHALTIFYYLDEVFPKFTPGIINPSSARQRVTGLNEAPPAVAAFSAVEKFLALVRGLIQLAPEDQITCRAARGAASPRA